MSTTSAIKNVSPFAILFVLSTLAFSRLGLAGDSLLAAFALTIVAVLVWNSVYAPAIAVPEPTKIAKTAKQSAPAPATSTYDFWLITELISIHSLSWARDDNAAHIFKYKGVEVLGITPDALFVFSFANGSWSKAITRIDSAHKMLVGSTGAIDMIEAAIKKNAPKPIVQTNQNQNNQNGNNQNGSKGNNSNNQNQNQNKGNNNQNNQPKKQTRNMPAVQQSQP